MDYLESNPPTPESIMPLIRAIGLASPAAESAATPASPKPEPAATPAPAPATSPTEKPMTPTGTLNLQRIREALAR
jgi:hypothetical protein